MADPVLKRASVTIRYTASDGYRSEVTYSNTGRMEINPPAEAPLLEALEELARLTSLFGFDHRARVVFDAARERVASWRRTRPTTGSLGDER